MPLPKAPAHPAEILEDYGTPATPESERKLPDVKIVNAMESHPAAAVKTGKRRNVKAARSAEPLPATPASKTAKTAQAPLTEPLSKKSVSKKLKAAQKSELAASPAIADVSAKSSAKPKRAAAPAKPALAPKAADTAKKAKSAPQKAIKTPAPSTKTQPDYAADRRRSGNAGRRGRAQMPDNLPKLFVLDTNVLMHDPLSLFRFAEHDVFLPMTVLEELDTHKKGLTDVARNARSVSRALDQLIEANGGRIQEGVELSLLGNTEATGRLWFETKPLAEELPAELPSFRGDNSILATVRGVAKAFPKRAVVLVSKDINMRIKATTLGIPAEDYFNDKVLDDTDMLYSGKLALPSNFWESIDSTLKSWQDQNATFYSFEPEHPEDFILNACVTVEGDANFMALNLLMDPDIDFVTLLGQAGTGKTLMTLAAALTQTIDERRFSEIIMTRATVSVGEDIGFLPGTEEEKMAPWMGALEDNLEVLHGSSSGGDWGRQATMDLIKNRIRVKSMSFMRGRTFLQKFVIIDEAQNLSPKQMKTLITRAGPGTKIVCLGNIAQIDTPYLTEGSSGLTYVVERFQGWQHAATLTLTRGERSRLAEFAAEAL